VYIYISVCVLAELSSSRLKRPRGSRLKRPRDRVLTIKSEKEHKMP